MKDLTKAPRAEHGRPRKIGRSRTASGLPFAATLFLGGAAGLLAGCTGWLGSGQNQEADSSRAEADGEPGTDPGGDEVLSSDQPLGPTLRLLTREQYAATLGSLFAFADSLDLSLLEEDVALNGSRSIGAATLALSPKETEGYLAIAEAAAARAFEDPTAHVGCDPSLSACASEYLANFGRRAFRRALTAEELTRFVALYEQGASTLSPADGLKYATIAFLMSPHFLYRVEVGEADAEDPDRRLLSSVELASKLSYFLWNAPPDEALLSAAEGGDLRQAELLKEQALRLMESPRFSDGLSGFFNDYLRLFELASVEKSPERYPNFNEALLDAMREETLLNLHSAARPEADFRRVFDSPTTFVNAELAAHYGMPSISGEAFVEAAWPPESLRSGLLGNGSLLSLYAHPTSSSPTLRGKFVRETLLCQAIPAPPPDVNTTLPPESESNTTRVRFAKHSTDPGCANCHQLMDPIGLGLENFDAVGQFRAAENGFPVDASGELDGATFQDPRGLAQALADHEELPSCLARTVFRYAWGRLENGADEAFLAELSAAFADQEYQLRALILSVVTDPNFYTLGKLD